MLKRLPKALARIVYAVTWIHSISHIMSNIVPHDRMNSLWSHDNAQSRSLICETIRKHLCYIVDWSTVLSSHDDEALSVPFVQGSLKLIHESMMPLFVGSIWIWFYDRGRSDSMCRADSLSR